MSTQTLSPDATKALFDSASALSLRAKEKSIMMMRLATDFANLIEQKGDDFEGRDEALEKLGALAIAKESVTQIETVVDLFLAKAQKRQMDFGSLDDDTAKLLDIPGFTQAMDDLDSMLPSDMTAEFLFHDPGLATCRA
jgi:hypothetical protein